MTFRIFVSCFLFVVNCLPANAYGQNNGPYAGEMRKVSAFVKDANNMSYRYTLLAEFPNGEKDRLSGTSYVGKDEKLMYNDNTQFTLLYTGKWYFKADHKEKTVTIVSLEKNLNKEYKERIEHDIFGGGTLSYYFDSVLLKYATVRSLKKSGDSVDMELGFRPESPIKSIRMAYDAKEKILTGYRIQTYEPWPTNEYGREKGTKQTIICDGFRKVKDNKEYKPDNFFTVKGKIAVLKKYKKYKLNTKI